MKYLGVIVAVLLSGCASMDDMVSTTSDPTCNLINNLHVAPENCTMLTNFFDREWKAHKQHSCPSFNNKRFEVKQVCAQAES